MTTQARELAKIVTNAGDLSLTDDVTLASDASVLNFGADSDVTLTHVADTGLLLNSTRQLQFGDSGTYIHQSADGVLDLVSDTEIELNATTLDINANVDISGTLTVAGALDFGDLDISNVGSLALDTITNDGTDITLDSSGDIILDADGGDVLFKDGGTEVGRFLLDDSNHFKIKSIQSDADILLQGNDGGSGITALRFDMSNAGNATFNGTISLSNNTAMLFSNAAGNATLGIKADSSDRITFRTGGAWDRLIIDGSGDLTIPSKIIHSGDTDNYFRFSDTDTQIFVTGNSTRMQITNSLIRLNQENSNQDFSVYSSNSDNMLYVDASADKVGIGTASPSAVLHVVSDSTSVDALYLESTEASSSAAPVMSFKRHSGSPADADYLGQIKFKGENDADQDVVYAKVTGKAGDVSDGSEDGIIEFANIKAGSATITARLKSDKLELVNGTTLEVSVDTDSIAEIGRAHVGGGITGLSDYAIFSHLHSADSGGYALAQNASGATFLNADDGQDIKFLAHGTTKMTMASDGNVGIGTTSPSDKLVVQKDSANIEPILVLKNDNTTDDNGISIDFSGKDTSANNIIYGRIGMQITNHATEKSHMIFSHRNNSGTFDEWMRVTHDGHVGIGASSPTGKLEIQNAQVTTQYDRDCFLRLHPSAHTNSGGFTNIFFGTSTSNNYGVALGGVRAGTNDAPEFSIRLLNDSISGVEMLNIDTNGSIKSKSGGMVLQTKEVYASTETSISSGSSAVICSTTITVQEGSKLAVWGHSGQVQNDGNGQNANMLIQWVSADGNTTTNISDHNGNHYGWDASTHVERMFITSQGISGTLSAATYTVRLLGGAYNGNVTMNYQSQGSHMIIQEISAN